MAKYQTIKDLSELNKLNFSKQGVFDDSSYPAIEDYSPNLGWLFYKEYYNGLESLKDENNIEFLAIKEKKRLTKSDENELKSFFTKKNNDIIDGEYNFQESSWLKGVELLRFKTVYPGLTTGGGLIHETGLLGEIKLGFQFDYTTGLPYIPGSSIKGLIRGAFPFSLKVKKAEESSSTTIEYRNNRYEYIHDIFKNLKDEKGNDISIDLSDSEIKILEFAIFAGTNAEGESLVFPERDIFLDAVVVAASTGLIGTDYITPHKDPLKDPKPIQFFKILPNVEFQFSFKLSNTILYDKKAYTEKGFEKLKSKAKEKEAAFDTAKIISVDMKKAVFKQIILDFGIGAKTNVGYGQFSK